MIVRLRLCRIAACINCFLTTNQCGFFKFRYSCYIFVILELTFKRFIYHWNGFHMNARCVQQRYPRFHFCNPHRSNRVLHKTVPYHWDFYLSSNRCSSPPLCIFNRILSVRLDHVSIFAKLRVAVFCSLVHFLLVSMTHACIERRDHSHLPVGLLL